MSNEQEYWAAKILILNSAKDIESRDRDCRRQRETDKYELETSPAVIYKPKIYIDGNQWCALYGENIQDGVCGFGDSPEKAFEDFNVNWKSKLPNQEGK